MLETLVNAHSYPSPSLLLFPSSIHSSPAHNYESTYQLCVNSLVAGLLEQVSRRPALEHNGRFYLQDYFLSVYIPWNMRMQNTTMHGGKRGHGLTCQANKGPLTTSLVRFLFFYAFNYVLFFYGGLALLLPSIWH